MKGHFALKTDSNFQSRNGSIQQRESAADTMETRQSRQGTRQELSRFTAVDLIHDTESGEPIMKDFFITAGSFDIVNKEGSKSKKIPRGEAIIKKAL
mmetsp:Transcript_9406/g.14378  ORF Transcript_9406/g.14378 Transcript_9406/m.14378 type:complete len:97 (-) Transcript_9406:781-1071(-)